MTQPRSQSMVDAIGRHLVSLYRLEPTYDLDAFVVPRSEFEGAPLDRPEQLVIRQEGDDLEVALVLDDDLLSHRGPWDLDRFCVVAEGVSHLLYLALAAEREAQISRFELELQAEIDKFALLCFLMESRGVDLITRLFLTSRLREAVRCRLERQRYQRANRLALQFCRYLEARYLRSDRVEGLLGELRRVYRMGGARKLSYVNECRP